MARGQWAQRAEQRAATHRRLVEAALAEFDRFGFANARVDRIASRANVSRGAFYGHFASLERAAYEVLDLEFEREREQLSRLHEGSPTLEEFLGALSQREDRRSESPEFLGAAFLAEMLTLSSREPSIREMMRRLFTERHEMIVGFITDLAATARLELAESPERIAFQLFAVELGLGLFKRAYPDLDVPLFAEEVLPGPFLFGAIAGPLAED